MKRIGILKNTIQEYAWGSRTAIPELLGQPTPSNTPQAEFWMGAHPKAPSQVEQDDAWMSLAVLIEKNPDDILGAGVSKKYNRQLPYLFKVLAAAKPLSIQAHPSRAQAEEGFEKETRAGVPLTAPIRNYKDANHKPECLCALTPFWALLGFRKPLDILSKMTKICPLSLKRELDGLQSQPDFQGFKRFFQALMTLKKTRRQEIFDETVQNASKRSEEKPEYKWITTLHKDYPSDIGVLSPLFLNLICLEPGQAMFLPSGELHAYLEGVGIELMANSDNVLRGGLTPKHVDVPELLKILNFQEQEIQILSPRKSRDCELVYACPAEEFVLSTILPKKDRSYKSPSIRSMEIILCVEGEATLKDMETDQTVSLSKGTSVMIPAAVKTYRIKGDAVLYKAAVSMN